MKLVKFLITVTTIVWFVYSWHEKDPSSRKGIEAFLDSKISAYEENMPCVKNGKLTKLDSIIIQKLEQIKSGILEFESKKLDLFLHKKYANEQQSFLYIDSIQLQNRKR